MRLLHAGDVDHRTGPAQIRGRAGQGDDPRASFRQLLSLYWLPGDRRRGRGHRESAQRWRAISKAKAEPQVLSELDRPNSYIGKSVPRPNLDRLMQGRGLY